MKLTDKNTMIKMLEHRVALLTVQGEIMNRGLIAKAKRQIRKLQKTEVEE